MVLRTVVCDDELPALQLLAELLEETGHVDVVATCQSVVDAIARINEGGVDLAVFDVEMPGLSGVEAYEKITAEPKPLLIFATAHADYALDAFDIDAIDYLLKPLEAERVRRAVDKARRLSTLIKSAEEGGPVEAGLPAVIDRRDTLQVRDGAKVHFVRFSDVVWIEAAGDYSLVHTAGAEYAMRTTITKLAEELPPPAFLRVHRSAIISPAHVREVQLLPKGEAQLTLSSGAVVRSSRRYREVIRQLTR
jgi:two-component system LytT family response regulator